jgi:hypothetical protein
MIISVRVPGGAYYRIFGVDPVGLGVGMISEGAIFYAALLLFGTAWWFFIGTIGWKSRIGNMNRPIAALGALLSLSSAVIAIVITKDALYQDLRDGSLSFAAIVQYACVGMLCLGALVITIYSMTAALGRNKPV